MIRFLAQVILYAPPLFVGLLVFRRLQKKYARPLDNRIDPRVWLFSVGATAAGYIIYVTLLALIAVLLSK